MSSNLDAILAAGLNAVIFDAGVPASPAEAAVHTDADGVETATAVVLLAVRAEMLSSEKGRTRVERRTAILPTTGTLAVAAPKPGDTITVGADVWVIDSVEALGSGRAAVGLIREFHIARRREEYVREMG